MPVKIVTVPCLSDNYAYLMHAPLSGLTALIDAPEAAPIENALKEQGWNLDFILITHHHADHIDAVDTLRAKYGASVIGAQADAHRLPALDLQVADGMAFSLGQVGVQVLDVSGHTNGHVAYYMPSAKALFSADSLMALGCGRLFEGTPAQMHDSLSRLAALPKDTMVYSGHEYTEANGRFAITVDPDNNDLQDRIAAVAQARRDDEPTVPSRLSEELATNPFLRAGSPAIQAQLDMIGLPADQVFAEIRRRKDNF